ncbi:MAG: putative ATP-dependent DNA helicase YjcD [bacterium ADurb.Bin429]|nr:MAG: putative ATP-dependent DNA helicase YjcD [bacterium ADurb.Bin429]
MSKHIADLATKYGPRALTVASYTRTASHEIADAAAKAIGADEPPVDRQHIGTLHSLCFHALGRPVIAEKKLRKEWNESAQYYALTSDGGADLDNPMDENTASSLGDKLFQQYNVLRSRMVPREMWPESVAGFARLWEDFKYQHDAMDFTDLIARALRDTDTAPGSPRIGIYDETQDFTLLQLALVRKWAKRMDYILLAGDDDQCIYFFTGANPDAFLDPPIDDDHKIILRQSYRVPRSVQAYAQRWIESNVRRREPKEYRPRDVEGEVRHLYHATYRHVVPLLADMRQYLEQGKTIMFLAPCGYMLKPLIELLRTEGVLFHNPWRTNRGDWNPVRFGGGDGESVSSVERLLAFLRTEPSVYGEDARLWTGHELYAWLSALKTDGVLRHGAKKKLKGLADFHDILPTDEMDALFTTDGYNDVIFNADLDWFEQRLLADKLNGMKFPIHVARKHGAKRLMEKPQISLGTIHSVKGGQADVVYLCGDLSTAALEEWVKVDSDAHDAIARTMYVGMTRARETLVLVNAVNFSRVELP